MRQRLQPLLVAHPMVRMMLRRSRCVWERELSLRWLLLLRLGQLLATTGLVACQDQGMSSVLQLALFRVVESRKLSMTRLLIDGSTVMSC